jgi:DNA-binding IclR family transcriptional regulator
MGQIDVFKWLRDRRAAGDESFYRISEIVKKSKMDKNIVWRACNKLYAQGYLEVKVEKWFRRYFRLKAKYVDVQIDFPD